MKLILSRTFININSHSMISRSIRQLVYSTVPRVQYAFSSHDEPPPTKLSKVKDIVVNLYVKNRYGAIEKSLFQAIIRMKVHSFDDIQGLCNGYDLTPHDNDTKGPKCGDCRVILEDNWFKRVHQETDGFNSYEEKILSTESVDLKKNTRLACCIPIESWMEGMTLSVDVTPQESEESILI